MRVRGVQRKNQRETVVRSGLLLLPRDLRFPPPMEPPDGFFQRVKFFEQIGGKGSTPLPLSPKRSSLPMNGGAHPTNVARRG